VQGNVSTVLTYPQFVQLRDEELFVHAKRKLKALLTVHTCTEFIETDKLL
jgi:hypothetical protein